MRRLVCAAMLILFASLNAIDGICCADGCTHEQTSASQPHDPVSPDGICVLCLGGVDAAVPQALSVSRIVTNRVARPLFSHHLDAPADPPEHPPRF